jgi:cysteine desulfurase/selenocysteine lyase
MDGVHRTTSARSSIAKAWPIRTGHHCAQPVMERFGIPATARASLAMLQHARGAGRASGARPGKVREVFA